MKVPTLICHSGDYWLCQYNTLLKANRKELWKLKSAPALAYSNDQNKLTSKSATGLLLYGYAALKMCWLFLDQNVMGSDVQWGNVWDVFVIVLAVIHKQQIQLWTIKWEFYDLFELCAPFTARWRIGFRLTMTSQWLELKLSTFSALDSSQISMPNGPTTNICQIEKEQWIVVVWAAGWNGNVSLSPWNIETRVSPQPPKPKRDWTNQSINQLQSLAWEGLKQPTRPIITSVDETTAEQLSHTKRKVPLFVFGQGLSSKVEDKYLALQSAEKKLVKAAPKFYPPLQHRED